MFKLISLLVLILVILSNVLAIYDSNVGIKTVTYRRDPRITEAMHTITGNSYPQYQQQATTTYSNRENEGRAFSTSTNYHQISQPSDVNANTYYQQSTSRVYQNGQGNYNNRGSSGSSSTASIASNSNNNIHRNSVVNYMTECPPNETGQFPYLMDCRQFLNCWKGRGYVQACAPGTVFNPETLECDNPMKVVCHSYGGSSANLVSAQSFGRVEGSYQPPSTNTQTTRTSTRNRAVECSPNKSGLEPHPYDCAKFLNCANGITYIQDCGPGTVFNPIMSVCDHPRNVDCGSKTVVHETTYSEDNLRQGTQQGGVYSQGRGTGEYGGSVRPTQHHHHHHHYHPNTQSGENSWSNGQGQQSSWNSGHGEQSSWNTGRDEQSSWKNSQGEQSSWNTGQNTRQPHQVGWTPPNQNTPSSSDVGQAGWSNTRGWPHHHNHNHQQPSDSATSNSHNTQIYTHSVGQGSGHPHKNYIWNQTYSHTTTQSNQPSHQNNSFNVVQATVRQIPINQNPDDSTISTSNTKIYYAEPVDSEDDTIFENVSGGDISEINISSGRNNIDQSNIQQQQIPVDSLTPPKTDSKNSFNNFNKPISSDSNDRPTVLDSKIDFNQFNSTLFGGLMPPYLPDQSPKHLIPAANSTRRNFFIHIPSTDMLPPPLPTPSLSPPLLPGEPNSSRRNFMTHVPSTDMLPPPLPTPSLSPPLLPGEPNSSRRNFMTHVPSTDMLPPPLPTPSLSLLPPHESNRTSFIRTFPIYPPPSKSESRPYEFERPQNDSLISTSHNVKTFMIYPPVQNVVNSTNQILYSRPYSGVTHSNDHSTLDSKNPFNINTSSYRFEGTNIINPSTKPTTTPAPIVFSRDTDLPSTFQEPNESMIVPIYSRPLNIRPVSVSSTNSPQTYNRQYYKQTIVSNNEDQITDETANLPLSEAIKTLLRPYFNRSGTITEEDAKKTDSYIMKIGKVDQNNNRSLENPQKNDKPIDEKQVELIFSGEQENLNQESWTTQQRSDGDPQLDVRGDYQPGVHNHTGFHHHHHHHNHIHHPHHHGNNNHHSPEFHRTHPHLPNPFNTNGNNNNNNNYNNNNNNDGKTGYNTNQQPAITPTFPPETETISVPNSYDQRFNYGTTTPTYYPRKNPTNSEFPIPESNVDNNQECKFDCGNGKCIPAFEVCDGINHCGNRLDEQYCDHLGYEVRLSNEEGSNHKGRVEVKVYGKWGYICDDKFGMRDADVLCRELGFPLGASEVRGNSYYPPHIEMMKSENDVLFVMDEIDCLGNETSLRECDFKGWGVHDCTADEIVGVVCKTPAMICPNDYWLCKTSQECLPPAFVCDNVFDCTDRSDENEDICSAPLEYRLANGNEEFEGRLEVNYRGVWGSICDDDFGEAEAIVACKYLGYHGKPIVLKNKFGPGTGPIWLDQVSCFGNETSLDQCSHWQWSEHNCNHSEDVSIRCSHDTATVISKGIKGFSTQEQVSNEEFDMYLYQVERSGRLLQQTKRCGHIFADLNIDHSENAQIARVVKGNKAKRGGHPWQATLRAKGRSGKSSHWCGAVLITKKHLLTAAHCLTGFAKGAYIIRLGDHHAEIAESSEIDIHIENWYIHEEFREGQHMNNDIALIVLKQPARFNDYIQPICLPSKNSTYDSGRNCTISGWGSIQSGQSTPSNDLRSAQIPIISDDICKQSHVYGDAITDGMFCAGFLDESVDACEGDSGGPLVCSDDDAETLYGLISWGQHCGYPNKPGVYIKITHYLDWIIEKIRFSLQSELNS